MLRRLVFILLLVARNSGLGDELLQEMHGTHDTRVSELEQIVSSLQSQLDALEGRSASQSTSESHSSLLNAEAPFSHGVTYDNGWTLRPKNPQRTPFELKVNLQNQFRYTGFASNEPSMINAAGRTVATPSRNDFDINRGRLIVSGHAIDPLLEYYANVDYNTVADQQIQMLMAWVRHPFDPAFNVAYGLGKVPGTWEWQESSRVTLGAERSLATTFFRPSMTAGIWADGELFPGFHYHTLIGNGFNTFNLSASEVDTNLVYSGMLWWEPLGEFGPGFSDIAYHSEPVVRVGQALTFSRQDAAPTLGPGPEQTAIRLSDGTKLVEEGALGPGVTVNQFDLTLYTIHAGLKHRGCSLSGEYFFRWLNNISGNGSLQSTSVFDHGFFVQAGTFVIPKTLEIFGRGSAVLGPYGNGSECAGGVNWYVKGKSDWRFTMDVSQVEDSPAQQDRTGFIAGGSGLLMRAQIWTYF